jgi:hypothetical protein
MEDLLSAERPEPGTITQLLLLFHVALEEVDQEAARMSAASDLTGVLHARLQQGFLRLGLFSQVEAFKADNSAVPDTFIARTIWDNSDDEDALLDGSSRYQGIIFYPAK